MSLSRVNIKYFRMAVGAGAIGHTTDNDITALCPMCGATQKNKSKKRLHLYEKNNLEFVHCFNSGCALEQHKTVYSFLRDFYPELLQQYKRETFGTSMDKLKAQKAGVTLGSLVTKKKIEIPKERPKPVQTQDLSGFMLDLKESDKGIMYLRNRGIEYRPQKNFGKWYFGTQDLKIGDTLYKIKDSIIVPLYFESEMYGFYSRSISEKNFITRMADVNIGYKIWNWFVVDPTKEVFIFEGIFDAISSGKKNIIALLGAKLPDERLKELKHPVFCLDADTTGLNNALEYAKKGYSVYIQPSIILEKDMNEVMLKHPTLDIPKMIDDNTYKGISAEIRIKQRL